MEISFSNKTIKIRAIFYDSMVKLEGRYYLDKMPKGAAKHPMKYRKLKNGKISVYAVFFIPNGFIFDALCIDDKKTKQQISDWLEKLIDDIAKHRGVEAMNNKED